MAERDSYRRLPAAIDPDSFVIEVPSFEDDRPEPPPIPPAASPQLVAATQIAAGGDGPHTIRRTQVRAGLLIAGVPICGIVVIAIAQILLAR
ncbi:hypothetical protein [Curtobacterium ammoniigenes]|uniref:hypothetical protein n=1 Tax=Curtobacterium ammoniigenes TaxID=395387 RepID=UPI000831B25D|nr:hypothetical protein [Curtobacterium ammoniigenes]